MVTLLMMSCACGWLGYYVTHSTDMMGMDVSRLVMGIIVSVFGGFIALVLIVFLTTHISMILQGVTTLEVYEKRGFGGPKDEGCLRTICCPSKDPVTGKPLHGGSIYRLPTALANFKAALGDDFWLWWAPTLPKWKTGSTDGMKFQTSQDVDREAVEMEDDSPLISKLMSSSSPVSFGDRFVSPNASEDKQA